MVLEIDNIELYFKDKRVLNGIYLKTKTGEVTGILGSNGCGKSCLLNIAFGNLTPKFKLIRIDGEPILKPLFKTGLVKFLPQHNFIPNSLKVKTAFKIFDLDWKTFINTFEGFSIYKNFKFNKLSGGERRIIETYIVLKSESEFIFLDEPFSHISPIYVEKIKALISIEKEYKAIIISDHMYRHIIDTSDNIYLLKNGCTKLINNIKELEDYKYLSIGSLE